MSEWIDIDLFVASFPSVEEAKSRVNVLIQGGYVETKEVDGRLLMRLTTSAKGVNTAFIRMIYEITKIAISEYIDAIQESYKGIRSHKLSDTEIIILSQVALAIMETQARRMVEHLNPGSDVSKAVRDFVDATFNPDEALVHWQSTEHGLYPKSKLAKKPVPSNPVVHFVLKDFEKPN